MGSGPGVSDLKETEVIDIEHVFNQCKNLSSYPFDIGYTAFGLMNGSPLICGGYNTTGRTNQCYIFKEDKFQHFTNMKHIRSSAWGIFINRDTFWISGGYDPHFQAQNTTEFVFLNGTVGPGPNLPAPYARHCKVNLYNYLYAHKITP